MASFRTGRHRRADPEPRGCGARFRVRSLSRAPRNDAVGNNGHHAASFCTPSQPRTRASGSAFWVTSETTAMESAPAAKMGPACSSLMPPIATSGMAPTRFFHSLIFGTPCGAKRTVFSVVGVWARRGLQFLVVMGGEAEREAGSADSFHVGIGQVFLPQMQVLRLGL